jgi:hypothetical protein
VTVTTTKDGIITAMLRGAELSGDCDTLVPVTKKELKAAWTATVRKE